MSDYEVQNWISFPVNQLIGETQLYLMHVNGL